MPLRSTVALIGLFLLHATGLAQGSQVSARIDALRASGAGFQHVSLFELEPRTSATQALWSTACRTAEVLRYDQRAAQMLIEAHPERIALTLPSAEGLVILDLDRVEVVSDGFQVRRASDGAMVDIPEALHYRGAIRGSANSLAAISVFAGELMGLVSDASGQRVIGRFAQAPAGLHVLYRESDLLGSFDSPCATADAPVTGTHGGTVAGDRSMRCVHFYWEAAHDIYLSKGSVANTVNYATGLFNQSATLFDNDGIDILLNEVFVWDVASPYNANSSSGRLSQFGTVRTSFNGELAHLLDYGGYGGVAWLNVLCSGSTSSRMAYSGIHSGYNNVPTYSWSVEVVSHEAGHNLGSPHTHACQWNGNSTAIDGCGPTAGYSEGSCPNAGLPAGGGTVMSYCHLIGGTGINFNNGFGPQPAQLMRDRVNAATCLLSCGTTCDAPGQLGTQNLWTSSATLTWANVGAASYDLRWKPASSGTWNDATGLLTNAYPISGLTQTTAYEFQVLSHCTGGATSTFSALHTFTTPAPCPDALEPNNTLATAAAITLPTNISALIATVSDEDHYTFTVSNTSMVYLSMSGLPADYDLRLLSSTGTQLAISQNSGTGYEYISYNAPAGTYVVHVFGYAGAFNPTQCYSLFLSSYTAMCNAPQGLNATNVTWNSATLNWSSALGASSFELQWKPTALSTWTSVPGLLTNTCNLTGLAHSTPHQFRVRAFCQGGGSGASEFSQIASFTTTTPPCEVLPPILVSVKVLLEGPYKPIDQLMIDSLRSQGLIPLTEPYSVAGFTLTGATTTTAPVLAVTGNDAPVDWVLLELRNAATPTTVVETHAGLLQRDGDIVSVDGTSPLGFCAAPGTYRLAVRHRNHLGTMTEPLALNGTVSFIDLTLPATPTYGTDARKPLGAVMALWAGNTIADVLLKYTGLNNDRDPILTTVGSTSPNNTATGYQPTDVNMDGLVKYTGLNNDRDPILLNVGNTTPNNVRVQQLP